MKGAGGHGPKFLKSPFRIYPHKFQILADMAVSRLAGRAGSTVIQRAYYHFISFLKTKNAFPHFVHNAGALMPDDGMPARPFLHATQKNMDIRTADTAIRYFYSYLPLRRRSQFLFPYGKPSGFLIKCRFHFYVNSFPQKRPGRPGRLFPRNTPILSCYAEKSSLITEWTISRMLFNSSSDRYSFPTAAFHLACSTLFAPGIATG